MAQHALDPAYRRVSVEEFLAIDLGGARAELEDGIIYMMAGGSEVHARIAGNLVYVFRAMLRGTGCRPYGSDFAVRTEHRTVRFPDVSVYCNIPDTPDPGRGQLLGDPQVIVEVLSPSTASHDQSVKLAEYQALAGVREIMLIDPARERVRLVKRTPRGGWMDDWFEPGESIKLPSLGIVVPHTEIFARD